MTACIHNHARRGDNNHLSAGNLMTAQRRLDGLPLVKTGEPIELGHVIENGAPRIAPNQTPYVMTLSVRDNSGIRRRPAIGASK